MTIRTKITKCMKILPSGERCDAVGQCIHNYVPTLFGKQTQNQTSQASA